MKIALATSLALAASTASAFAPQPKASFGLAQQQSTTCFMNAKPSFFMSPGQKEASSAASKSPEELSLDEEVEALVQKEIAKSQKMSRLKDAKGNDYAPWMNISDEDEARIRRLMMEKAVARRKRQEQEKNVKGALLQDSQGQELAGTGLKSKVIDGSRVELEWATSSETSTRGFIVKRRAAKTDAFEVLASYETYGPLASQGPDGGVYRFMDEPGPGGWVYRVTEVEGTGSENDLSQCLVDVQTKEEQQGAVFALAAFLAVAVGAIAAGTLLDPVQY